MPQEPSPSLVFFSDRGYNETEDVNPATVIDSWEGMKKIYSNDLSDFLKKQKPRFSPDVKKWLDNGNRLMIDNNAEHEIWTYISSFGESVSYVDGAVVFPDEYLFPEIRYIDITRFSGSRQIDRKRIFEVLYDEYGLAGIPDGYVIHHDVNDGILQLVDERIHRKFSHIGGYSLFNKEE